MLHITLKNEQLFLTTIHMRKWSQKNMTTLYMSLGLYSRTKRRNQRSCLAFKKAWLKHHFRAIYYEYFSSCVLIWTMHEVFCYEHKGAPYYLSRAAHCTDKIERMKWMTVYVISQLYITTIQSKPFNPILGETFQCKNGDLNMYSEQTANHPITSNFYCFDDNRNYT